MNVTLLAHTQLNQELKLTTETFLQSLEEGIDYTSGQIVALGAIRQCYSHKTATEVIATEYKKYFSEDSREGRRLFNHIVKSGHTSTLEHITFTFAIEGVSRALLAQLTRHRHMSFSVQSQRYNKFSSGSRSEGFNYVVPKTITDSETKRFKAGYSIEPQKYFEFCMNDIQKMYDNLIQIGIPQEDARSVLPNSATCNLVMTASLRTILEFYDKRRKGNGAQQEITVLAERLKEEVIKVEPFTKDFFEV